MISVFSHTAQSFIQSVTNRLEGKGRIYAELIYKAWFREARLYKEESNARKLISAIHEITDRSLPVITLKVNVLWLPAVN